MPHLPKNPPLSLLLSGEKHNFQWADGLLFRKASPYNVNIWVLFLSSFINTVRCCLIEARYRHREACQ